MRQVPLSSVKCGDYFRRTKNGPVWVRGGYYGAEKNFSVYKFDDINHESFLRGSVLVWIDFEF